MKNTKKDKINEYGKSNLRTKFTLLSFAVVVLPSMLLFLAFSFLDFYKYESIRKEFSVSIEYDISMAVILIAVVLIICLLITGGVYNSWIKPINKLNEAIKKVSEGNFDFTIEAEGDDEFSIMCNNFDIMRKRMKESLDAKIQYDNENRELISNISHDLKTPITAIKGYVEGIMDGVADTPEKMDKYIRTISNKANDMDRLINELTLYSKIDTNRIPYNFHRIDVVEYFDDCREDIGLELDSKGIVLDYDNKVEAGTKIVADPEQIRRVINNIISNSVKYMDKENGRIAIRLMESEGSVNIEIEDNGKGIATKDIPNIFNRFYRTDASRNSAQGGSGIGLSIVKKIIEDHGGIIYATSVEGEGTTMHISMRKYLREEQA